MSKKMNIKLIIGLGNPEEKYENTRHNAGRETVLTLAKDLETEFAPDRNVKNCLIARVKEFKALLLLPQVYMNNSGKAVGEFVKKNKIKTDQIFIAHDDIDIPLGRMKLSYGKSSAGHYGVESVIKSLKSNEFWRLRIGIGSEKKKLDALKMVLKKWRPDELKIFKKIVKKATEAIKTTVAEGPDKAMTKYNQ